MCGSFHRSLLRSWLRRLRTAIENLSDNLERSKSRSDNLRSDPLAAIRCVWYGRAMFCLYMPQPHAPAKKIVAAGAERPVSDLHPGA